MGNAKLLENLKLEALKLNSDIRYSDIRNTVCQDFIPYNWDFTLDEIKRLIDNGKEKELYWFNSIKNTKFVNVLVKKLILDKFGTLQKFEAFLEKCYSVDVNPLPYLREWLPGVDFKFYYIQHSSWVPYYDNFVAVGYNQTFESVSVCIHTEMLDVDEDQGSNEDKIISKSSISEDLFSTDELKDDLESTTNTKQKKRRIIRKKTTVEE